MPGTDHNDLTGDIAVHPAAIVSATDPGAVGAHKFWVDTSTSAPFQLKKRNAANSAWDNVGSVSGLSFNDTEGNPADVVGAGVADGTSVYAARRDHVHELGIITARGGLIRGGASGVPQEVALGTAGYVLTSDGTDATWLAATGGGGSSGGGGSGALVPIQVIGPLTAAQATLSFAAPLTGFRNIYIKGQLRGSTAATSTTVLLTANSDTGNNYNFERFSLSATTATAAESLSTSSIEVATMPASTATAARAGSLDVRIPNYSNTVLHKNVYATNDLSFNDSTGNTQTRVHSGTWRSTAAITSLTLTPGAGSFDVGSYACLYGEMDTAGVLLTPVSNLLYETTLLAAAATIDTGTLRQSYRDMRVELSGLRGSASATEVGFQMRFNGDSGANYDWSRVSNSGSTLSGTEGAAVTFINNHTTTTGVTANTATSGAATGMVIHIPGYAEATYWKHCTLLTADSMGSGAGNRRPTFGAGHWRNTAPITSIQFTLSSGNFMAGASVRVYGEPVSVGGAATGTGTRVRVTANQSITTATATAIGWDVADNDADNQHFESAANLTGTVSKTAGLQSVAGSSTAFLTELSVGQVITVPGTASEKRVVTAITSNTALTVNSPFVNTATGQTAARVNSAVVFRTPGFYALEANIYSAALASGAVTLQFYLNSLTTATSGTPIGQRDPVAINASAGYDLVIQKQFQMWDFVEVVWTQNSGGNVNVLADERTHLSVNARPTVIVAVPHVVAKDAKAQNTAGGTFNSGADQTRTLNTLETDSAGIASLVTDQLTLPAGTYRYLIRAPGYQVGAHQAFLYNVTDTAEVKRGTSESAGTAATTTTSSVIEGRVTLSATKVLEVRHRCTTTGTTTGFGLAANFGAEVYTVAEFWKEG
jgi:hypothetical protein